MKTVRGARSEGSKRDCFIGWQAKIACRLTITPPSACNMATDDRRGRKRATGLHGGHNGWGCLLRAGRAVHGRWRRAIRKTAIGSGSIENIAVKISAAVETGEPQRNCHISG